MKRIDFRSLAEDIANTDDLIDPRHQSDHPTVKRVSDIAYFNALPGYAQRALEKILSSGKDIPIKEAYKAAHDDDLEVDDLTELLFTGLMTDTNYKGYQESKKKAPGITARDYYNYICVNIEKDKNVLKLAKIFEAILDVIDSQA